MAARSGRVSFFKDHKGYKSNPELTFRGEPSYDLQGAAIEIASDYTKKKHVLRVKWVPQNHITTISKYLLTNVCAQIGQRSWVLAAGPRWQRDVTVGIRFEGPERFGGCGGEQIPDLAGYFAKGRTKAQIVFYFKEKVNANI